MNNFDGNAEGNRLEEPLRASKPVRSHDQADALDRWIMGIDIGGTKTLMLLSSEKPGSEVRERKIPTSAAEQPDAFFKWLFDEVSKFCRDSGIEIGLVAGIGMGFPGVILNDEGILRSAPVFQWAEEDIRPVIATYFEGEIYLDNDVNMAAMGEFYRGAAQGHRHCVMVTVGTGIGSALILNGQLYSGQDGAAGEIGHFIVGDEGIDHQYKASSDTFGAFELNTSGTGITQHARRYFTDGPGNTHSLLHSLADGDISQIEARHVFKAAEAGDAAALEILALPLQYMARGLANIVALLNPSIIVVGGGVAASNPDYYLNELRSRLSRYTALAIEIVVAELGNTAGAFGALAAIRLRLQQR
ncbi:ROK family protein [Paenibacillus xylanexedens]|uniref:ROK family protein n=1 Tax=Paenibacillus xylanexedens TaxID=528191 RepID=UPI0011A7F9F0|nr:ROK family protein [Paenibacillus xylanexedens]